MAKLVKAKKPEITAGDTIASIMEYVVTIMLLAMIGIIPLYMKKAFYEIGQSKFNAYFNIANIFVGLLIFLFIAFLIFQRKQLSFSYLKSQFSTLDITVIIYGCFVLLSFAFCDFKEQAFMGYNGWNMGLYAQISFILLYFFVSRFIRDYKIVLYALGLISAIVFVFGILNRFLIDPLGVYEGIDAHYHLLFLSTLGQASWYSSYVCTVMPIGLFFFLYNSKGWMRKLSGVYAFLSFATMVTQNSDSAYIAFAGMMLVFLIYCLRDKKKMVGFFQLLIIFCLATKSIYFLSIPLDDTVLLQLDTLSKFLIFGKSCYVLLAISVVACALLTYVVKDKQYNGAKMLFLWKILLIAIGAFCLTCIGVLYYSAKNPESIGNSFLEKIPYLVWNDRWGNGRGFSWRVTWQMFVEMSPFHKLLGVGPECYPHYAYQQYKDVLDSMWGNNVLSNAHNEWYNAIINYGILGGVSYLAIFIQGMRSGIKKFEGIQVAFLASIVSYIGHNFFCYQQILCTPFVFIFLGIGEYLRRKKIEE